jgi:hypothetical protein
MDWLIFVLLLTVWIVLALFRRTRPLSLFVVVIWLWYQTSISLNEDKTIALASFVISLGLIGNFLRNRKKYLTQISGHE